MSFSVDQSHTQVKSSMEKDDNFLCTLLAGLIPLYTCLGPTLCVRGNVRLPVSLEQLLVVLSTAVGYFCGSEVIPCHCTAPRHLGARQS